MKYKCTSVVLKKNSAEGNTVAGLKSSGYNMVANLVPTNCIFGKSKKLPILDNQDLFNVLKPSFDSIQAVDGTKTLKCTDPTFPHEMLDVIEGGVDITVKLNGLYERVYTADVLDKNGNPVAGKTKGDVIKDDSGNPILYDTMTVFTLRVRDEDNPTGWTYPLSTPEELRDRYLKNGYRLHATQVASTADASNAADDAGADSDF